MTASLRTTTYQRREGESRTSPTMPQDEVPAVSGLLTGNVWARREILASTQKADTEATRKEPDATSALSPSLERSPVSVLAAWDGCVEHIGDFYFSAALRGLRGEGVQGQEEDAEIPLSD